MADKSIIAIAYFPNNSQSRLTFWAIYRYGAVLRFIGVLFCLVALHAIQQI